MMGFLQTGRALYVLAVICFGGIFMGRKPKCTVEEKISAVEDYLNGIRSVSEIMVDLSIKSTRTIRDWILAYQNGE